MSSTSKVVAAPRAGRRITSPDVAAVFESYPPPLRAKLLFLRGLIFETAAATENVGPIEETLKWGQPSYLTTESKSGSTLRLGPANTGHDQYALYFHCQTDLVASFRELYPGTLSYGGNRSIVFGTKDTVDDDALRHCIALALTYHLRKNRKRRSARRAPR